MELGEEIKTQDANAAINDFTAYKIGNMAVQVGPTRRIDIVDPIIAEARIAFQSHSRGRRPGENPLEITNATVITETNNIVEGLGLEKLLKKHNGSYLHESARPIEFNGGTIISDDIRLSSRKENKGNETLNNVERISPNDVNSVRDNSEDTDDTTNPVNTEDDASGTDTEDNNDSSEQQSDDVVITDETPLEEPINIIDDGTPPVQVSLVTDFDVPDVALGKRGVAGTNNSETLMGTNKKNTIIALDGDDAIDAKNGHDTVYAGTGDDIIDGGRGKDVLYGGSGNDIITGAKEDDIIYGGSGADTLRGDEGSGSFDDVFIFASTLDTGIGEAQRDIIADFGYGNDEIDISTITEFAYAGNGAFIGNGTASVRWENEDENTLLSMDWTGDGQVDGEILLQGVTSLSFEDISLT